MAESVFARPSFWKVPKEFRQRSLSPNPHGDFNSSLEHRDFLSENYYYEKIAQKSNQHQQLRSHPNQVTPLSSASDAGVKPGDVVIAVNNKSISGEPLDKVTRIIADDKSNNVSLTVGRPASSMTNRSLSPMAGYNAVNYYNPSPLPPTVESTLVARTLPRSPIGMRRYDPGSIQDQERQVYEEEKYNEQLAIKTTPYRSQAVVSPKPKTKHDHVIGSYLKMQHYPDAPIHGSPVPESYLPAGGMTTNMMQAAHNQARFNSAVKAAAPTAEELGFKLTYNSPIGLYSQQNAVNTLRQTNPMSSKSPVQGAIYDPAHHSTASVVPGSIPKPVRLVPDDTLVDGADFARNLANSPTYRLVQELEGPGRVHDAVNDRVYTPVPVYEERQFGDPERHSPAQSASFKSLMNSLIAHPNV